MRHTSTLLVTSALAALVRAQQTCSSTQACGVDAPCCSEFNFCGSESTGFCRSGCNPMFSHTPTSCSPIPVCQDATYTFTSLDSIVDVHKFNGNASAAAFTLDGGNIDLTANNELVLMLTETNNGTRVSTTRYVHYGEITATMRTGKWNGVVTAFITMSDAHDEIDWEWPGSKSVGQGQSNFYWLGVIDPQPGYHNISSDASANYHDYTINWQEDTLSFAIDGTTVRTVKKADTLDAATGIYKYPTTPARVELSLWPAGLPGNPKGTVDWSGGQINWADPDYVAAGHFYTFVKQLSIKCATVGAAALGPGDISYVYGPNVSNVPSVLNSNLSTVPSSSAGVLYSGLRALAPFITTVAVAAAALML